MSFFFQINKKKDNRIKWTQENVLRATSQVCKNDLISGDQNVSFIDDDFNSKNSTESSQFLTII